VAFTAWLLPGIHVDAFWPDAMLAVVAIGLVNAIVRPILVLLTLPITILTLGLFLWVVNGASLQLAAWMLPGFHVSGLFAAMLGSVVLSVTTSVLGHFVFRKKK
jgi:putative membrane protein